MDQNHASEHVEPRLQRMRIESLMILGKRHVQAHICISFTCNQVEGKQKSNIKNRFKRKKFHALHRRRHFISIDRIQTWAAFPREVCSFPFLSIDRFLKAQQQSTSPACIFGIVHMDISFDFFFLLAFSRSKIIGSVESKCEFVWL